MCHTNLLTLHLRLLLWHFNTLTDTYWLFFLQKTDRGQPLPQRHYNRSQGCWWHCVGLHQVFKYETLLAFLGSILFCQSSQILSDYCPKMNAIFLVLAFFQNCSECNFIIFTKKKRGGELLSEEKKRRNRIFWEAASFFIAPFIDFSSHQKLQFLFLICECVYGGFLLNNCSLHLLSLFITASTLFIFMPIKQADTCHPPILFML